jgi:hypothetical protein
MSDSLHTDLVCAAIDDAADYIHLQPDCIFILTVAANILPRSSALA